MLACAAAPFCFAVCQGGRRISSDGCERFGGWHQTLFVCLQRAFDSLVGIRNAVGTLESFLTVAEWRLPLLFCCNCTKQTNMQPDTKKPANGLKQSPVFGNQNKKKSQTSPDPPRPPGPPGAPCAAWCHRRSLLHGIFLSLSLRHKSISSVFVLVPAGRRSLRKVGGLAGDELGEFREGTRPLVGGQAALYTMCPPR